MYKHQLVAQHDHLGAVLQHHDPHEQHVRVPLRGALCARTAANRTFGHTTPALASSTTPSRSTLGVPSPCSAPRPDTSRWARSAAPWSGKPNVPRWSSRSQPWLGELRARSCGHHQPHCGAIAHGCLGSRSRCRRRRRRRRRWPGPVNRRWRRLGSRHVCWSLCGQRADRRKRGYTRHEEAAGCRCERGQSSRTPLLSCRHSWRAFYRVLATFY